MIFSLSRAPMPTDQEIMGRSVLAIRQVNVRYGSKADVNEPHRDCPLSAISGHLQKQGAGTLASRSKPDRSTDIAGVRLVQKRTSRVPKHGPPGHTSCDGGMIRQSFW